MEKTPPAPPADQPQPPAEGVPVQVHMGYSMTPFGATLTLTDPKGTPLGSLMYSLAMPGHQGLPMLIAHLQQWHQFLMNQGKRVEPVSAAVGAALDRARKVNGGH